MKKTASFSGRIQIEGQQLKGIKSFLSKPKTAFFSEIQHVQKSPPLLNCDNENIMPVQLNSQENKQTIEQIGIATMLNNKNDKQCSNKKQGARQSGQKKTQSDYYLDSLSQRQALSFKGKQNEQSRAKQATVAASVNQKLQFEKERQSYSPLQKTKQSSRSEVDSTYKRQTLSVMQINDQVNLKSRTSSVSSENLQGYGGLISKPNQKRCSSNYMMTDHHQQMNDVGNRIIQPIFKAQESNIQCQQQLTKSSSRQIQALQQPPINSFRRNATSSSLHSKNGTSNLSQSKIQKYDLNPQKYNFMSQERKCFQVEQSLNCLPYHMHQQQKKSMSKQLEKVFNNNNPSQSFEKNKQPIPSTLALKSQQISNQVTNQNQQFDEKQEYNKKQEYEDNDEYLDDPSSSFFCKVDDENCKQGTQVLVNRIPVSPKKKHKPNNELDFFFSNKANTQLTTAASAEGNNYNSSRSKESNNNNNNALQYPKVCQQLFSLQYAGLISSVTQSDVGYKKTSNLSFPIPNCEENQQINDHQISRFITNKSLTSIKDERSIFAINYSSQLTSISNNHQILKSTNITPQCGYYLTQATENKSLFESLQSNLKNAFKRLSYSKRIQCNCDEGLKDYETCSKATQWLYPLFPDKSKEYLSKIYEKIKQESIQLVEPSIFQQIDRDLTRTYPDIPFYDIHLIQHSNNLQGIQILKSVLVSFAAYEPQIGYVQGMNFIAANFLYHCEEYICFWLLVNIFERLEMRDIYLPNLPGLKKHCQILSEILNEFDQQISHHLEEQGVKPDMFLTPWLFSLFGVMIPLQFLDIFYSKLINQGWCYFYKFIVNFLIDNREDLLSQDIMGIMTILTSKNYQISNEKYKVHKEWKQLLEEADRLPLSHEKVENLLNYFNQEQYQ